MTLGSDLTAVLPELRTHAESRMVDTCRVVTNPDATVWDPVTLTDAPADAVVSYEGPVLVKPSSTQPGGVDLSGQPVTVTTLEAHFPVVGSEGIRIGHVVEMLTGLHDPGLVGRRFRVIGPQMGSFITARRLPVEDYDGG